MKITPDTLVALVRIVLVGISGVHGRIEVCLVAHEVAVNDMEISKRTDICRTAYTTDLLGVVVVMYAQVGEFPSLDAECLVISLVVSEEGVVGTKLVGSRYGTAYAGIVDSHLFAFAVKHLVRTTLGTVLLKSIHIEVYRSVGAECTAESCRVVDKLAVCHDEGNVTVAHGSYYTGVLVYQSVFRSLVVVITIAVAVYHDTATTIVVVLTHVGGTALDVVHAHTACYLHTVEDDSLALLVVERSCTHLFSVVCIG